MDELAALGAAATARIVGAGEVSAREAVWARLAHLDALAGLNAVVARDDEAALAQAAALDRRFAAGGPIGPLHGVPVTVKDWIDVAGLPCAGESGDHGRVPAADASVVARLRAAGAVVVAKTNVGVDHLLFGPCRHPLDPARSPGGSSSGEAALVGAGGSCLGIGSDSGGSIRLPASWCGAMGLKPTFGRVPLTGHFPRIGALHDGRTVIGPLAAHVDDLRLCLSVIHGPDGRDAACAPVPLDLSAPPALRGARVAWLVDDGEGRASPEAAAAVRRALTALHGAGAVVADEPLAGILDESLDITRRYWSRTTLDGPANDRLLWDWDRFRRRLLTLADGFDLVVTPSTAGVAPPARALDGLDYVFTLPWSLTGWPVAAVAMPGGGPLPLGVQVVGHAWRDDAVLDAAWTLGGR